ncbi:MAG: hypothetical protein UIH27_10240, partial [Ruminococcus sp.]|nr:hypothetical protein [Ruminococcus sp.]
GTRGEISSEVNRGFLSRRFLDYSLREFGLRRPLEMTYGGKPWLPVREISRLFATRIRLTPTARNDIWRKRSFHCPHSLRYFYSISRNADVTEKSDIKYAS